ncbi:hypothetical protein MHBO_004618, partial [Bonamia ostreae]
SSNLFEKTFSANNSSKKIQSSNLFEKTFSANNSSKKIQSSNLFEKTFSANNSSKKTQLSNFFENKNPNSLKPNKPNLADKREKLNHFFNNSASKQSLDIIDSAKLQKREKPNLEMIKKPLVKRYRVKIVKNIDDCFARKKIEF